MTVESVDVRADAVKALLGSLNHNDDSMWTKEGAPRLERLASMIAPEVTAAEVAAVTIGGKPFTRLAPESRQSGAPVEAVVDNDPRMRAQAGPAKPGVAPTVQNVAAAKARAADLDEQIRGLNDEFSKIRGRLDTIMRERDVIARFLDGTRDHDHMATIKAYQASQLAQAYEKRQQLDKIAAVIRQPVQTALSPLDQRLNVKRRAPIMSNVAGAVVQPRASHAQENRHDDGQRGHAA